MVTYHCATVSRSEVIAQAAMGHPAAPERHVDPTATASAMGRFPPRLQTCCAVVYYDFYLDLTLKPRILNNSYEYIYVYRNS